MEKKLYAKISVEKENERKDVKVYKLKNEKFGIEVETECNGNTDVKRVEDLTSSEENINRLLEILVVSAENFTLLEDFAYDFKDKEEVVI